MKKRMFSTVMAIIMIFSLCLERVTTVSAAAPADAKKITVSYDIVNQTGFDILSIKLSPAGQEAWTKVPLDKAIKNGKTVKIPLTYSSNKTICDLSIRTTESQYDMPFFDLDFSEITAAGGGILYLRPYQGLVFNKTAAKSGGLPVGKDTITTTFNIKNELDGEIIGLQLSLREENKWSQNLIKAPIGVGAKTALTVIHSKKAPKWDLQLFFSDGSVTIDIDLTGITAKSGDIILRDNKAFVFSKGTVNGGIAPGSDTTTVHFKVKNDTKAEFMTFKLSPPNQNEWGPNLLAAPLAPGATVTIPITYSFEKSLWDIQCLSSEMMSDVGLSKADFSSITPESGGNMSLQRPSAYVGTVVISNNRVKTPYPKQSGDSIMFFDTDSDSKISAYEAREQILAVLAAEPNRTTGFSMTLSDKITTISRNAFENMPITKLTLPSSVKVIEDEAFANAYSLKSITFAEGLETTGYGAFLKTGISSVTLPQSLKTLGDNTFGNCENLSSITLKEGLVSIGVGAFTQTPIKGIILPESLVTIGRGAFTSCRKLKSISIPAGVKKIEDSTFNNCVSLTDVKMLGITSIENQAFLKCTGLKQLQLPATLKSVGPAPIEFCTNMVAFSVDPANPNFTTQDGILYSKDLTEIYAYPNARADKTLVLPSTVKTIKAGAFANTDIKAITLSTDLKTIEERAFNVCKGLKGIQFSEGLEKIGTLAFQNCTNLSGDIVLPKSMKEYGLYAFSATSLKNVTFNSSIDIYSNMFMACDKLETVKINTEISKIWEQAFFGCSRLKNINLPKTLKTIDSGAFAGCKSMAAITLPEGLLKLGKPIIEIGKETAASEANVGVFDGCTSLKTIVIPNSVTYIEAASFANCTSMKSAKLPLNAKYKTIEPTTFQYSGLEDIFIPKNVITIGDSAFFSSKLKKMTIEPNGVKYIKPSAFAYTKLEEVVIPVGVIEIEFWAFMNINPLKTVTLSSTIKILQGAVFVGCPSLITVNLNSLDDIQIYSPNFDGKTFANKGSFHLPKNFYGDNKIRKTPWFNNTYYINDLPALPKGK